MILGHTYHSFDPRGFAILGVVFDLVSHGHSRTDICSNGDDAGNRMIASVSENLFAISSAAPDSVTLSARFFSIAPVVSSAPGPAVIDAILSSLRAGVTVFSPVAEFSVWSETVCPPTSPVALFHLTHAIL